MQSGKREPPVSLSEQFWVCRYIKLIITFLSFLFTLIRLNQTIMAHNKLKDAIRNTPLLASWPIGPSEINRRVQDER